MKTADLLYLIEHSYTDQNGHVWSKYEESLAEKLKECLDLLKEMTEVYSDLVEDGGGCDHSVNICWCHDHELIHRAKELLDE